MNALSDLLDAGRRPIAVELDPPKDTDGSWFWEGAALLRDAGADAVTVADGPGGRPCADSGILACGIRQRLGIAALPHLTCRDRNRNAVEAFLLGLAASGIRDVLVVTGDPIPPEARGGTRPVFDYDPLSLTRRIRELGEGMGTPFRVFGALDVNARPFGRQLERALKKEEAGAYGFLTQPVLSQEALENLGAARAALRGKILGGIYPIVSYKNARFLDEHVHGIRVAPEILARYEGADREAGEELALEISARTASETAPCTDGLYLMTPFRRVGLMVRLLDQIRDQILDRIRGG